MLKKYKIFVCLLILLGILLSFVPSVFASTDTYSFNGFDGVTYNLPSLPEGVNNYNHYVIVKSEYNDIYILCFNDSLNITHSSSFISLDGDNDTTLKLFELNDSSWRESGEQGHYSFSSGAVFINSCLDLIKYADSFNGGEDFFYNPPTVEVQGTLPPIIQVTPLEGVLQEIVEILPIVLVTIVGLIGLRKALRMLSRVLHRS